MLLRLLAVLAWWARVPPAAASTNYCKIRCPVGTRHSACDSDCNPAPNVQILPQTLQFRQAMLDVHNSLRELIASGTNTTGGNSEASNMAALSYDMDLEFTVSCWLYQTGKTDSDDCRGTVKFREAGQNIYKGEEFDPTTEAGARQVVKAWFAEIRYFGADQVDYFTNQGMGEHEESIAHFTQVVWAETTHIGCAMCRTDDKYYLVGCNYGPAGNRMHTTTYVRGPPASGCKEDVKPNMKYLSLCGETEPMPPAGELRGNPGIKGAAARPLQQALLLAPLLARSLL